MQTTQHKHYLDRDIEEPLARIIAQDNMLIIEACCVLTELMAATEPSFRDAVVERWPQLADRIKLNDPKTGAGMLGAFRTMMALDIENSHMADENPDLWRIANILRHRVR